MSGLLDTLPLILTLYRCTELIQKSNRIPIVTQIVEEQRQTVALPFWGIAGLGLLFGVSLNQPICLLAAIVGTVSAYRIQKWGWQLQARSLLLQTLEDIEARIAQPNK